MHRKTPSRHRSLVATLLILVSVPVMAADDGQSTASRALKDINFQVENDLFVGNGYDRHYTHGMRLSTLYDAASMPDLITTMAKRTWLDGDIRGELGLGMSMFTPEDISTTALQPNDRPYAGWTYLSFGLFSEHEARAAAGDRPATSARLDTFSFEVGIVGPSSQAGDIQTWWHDEVISAPHPSGWRHQLSDELAGSVYLSSVWRRPLASLGGVEVDLLPSVGMAFGTVDIYAAAGGTVRIGLHLDDDFGPPRIRPNRPGAGFLREPASRLSGYVFAGVEGRVVGRNLFLDGNTFAASHSVARKDLVADGQIGAMLAYGPVRFSYAQFLRSREYATQDTPDSFGAFSLTVNLPF